MMRSVLCIAFLALAIVSTASGRSSAQAPELLSYQGVLMQSDGLALDGNGQLYQLNFRLYPQQSGGSHVFHQRLNVAVEDGLYNVILSNNGIYSLANVIAENSVLFMEVEIESGPGISSAVVLQPRQQLASVPYALNAGASQSSAGSVMVTQTLTHVDSVEAGEGVTVDWGFDFDGRTVIVPGPDHYIKVSGTLSLTDLGVMPKYAARGKIRLKQKKDEEEAVTVVVNRWLWGAPIESISSAANTFPLHYVLEAPAAGEYTFTVELYVGNNEYANPTIATQGDTDDVSILTVEVIPKAQ